MRRSVQIGQMLALLALLALIAPLAARAQALPACAPDYSGLPLVRVEDIATSGTGTFGGAYLTWPGGGLTVTLAQDPGGGTARYRLERNGNPMTGAPGDGIEAYPVRNLGLGAGTVRNLVYGDATPRVVRACWYATVLPPLPTPTLSPSPTPTDTPEPTPTLSPSPTPTDTPEPTPTLSPSPTPTDTPEPTPTLSPSPTPTETPAPVATPSPLATLAPPDVAGAVAAQAQALVQRTMPEGDMFGLLMTLGAIMAGFGVLMLVKDIISD